MKTDLLPRSFFPLALLASSLTVCSVSLPASATTFVITKEMDDNGPCELTDCSLREAILAANASPGMDTVILPAGLYQLSITGTNEWLSQTGSLDIVDDLEILGESPANTIITADRTDRVLSIDKSLVQLRNLTIEEGQTPGSGAGLFITNSEVRVDRCVIKDNEVTLSDGGGIYAFESAVTIENTTILHNSAYGDGGGIFRFGAFPTGFSDMRLINSTVSGNSAFQGGGASTTFEGRLILINSTVANNAATFRASALWMIDSRGPILTNSLIVGSCGFFNTGGTISNGGNIESPGTNCAMTHPTDRMGVADPGLGPLVSSGGSTPSHPLLAGSPAIDSALDAACPATDQRGVERPQDGDGDGVAACDVGAFERLPDQPPSVEIPALGRAGELALVLLLGIVAMLGLRRRRSSDGSSTAKL